ncbi:hypothetical protein GIB67_007182 [Kingdonia uniflora]|uniref:Uncharacterized protein n=1 Tax=Kingdonia uniflora TaxID=39325 RepID=A0A7J7NDG9_9MAGN|nr:hypothetical protein GIB67_007182 [Kingdonia uniflora]
MSQVPTLSGFPAYPYGDMQMFPIMYPALIPGLIPLQNAEFINHGAGIYAIPVIPFMGSMTGLTSNTLIPLTYNIPTRTSTPEGGAVGVGQEAQQQHVVQRQVIVRRFHFAFQIDLLLILKLAAVTFIFNQDGSRHRLILLVFFAAFVYLYQTGAFTPLMRWLSQNMRAGAPPQPRPVVRAEKYPGSLRLENGNAAAAPEGQHPGAENLNRSSIDNGDQTAANENHPAPPEGNLWIIVKEIRMIVVGFITSLLPGF